MRCYPKSLLSTLAAAGWKPGDGSVDRGLGLGLIRSLMDNVEMQGTKDGTTVIMERQVALAQV